MLSNQEESAILIKALCLDCLPIRQNREGRPTFSHPIPTLVWDGPKVVSLNTYEKSCSFITEPDSARQTTCGR
jgi:hypothetical protein